MKNVDTKINIKKKRNLKNLHFVEMKTNNNMLSLFGCNKCIQIINIVSKQCAFHPKTIKKQQITKLKNI